MQSADLTTHGSEPASTPEVNAMRTYFGTPRPYVDPVLCASDPGRVVANPRIAIVDDQPINVKVVQGHLKAAGYRQFFAATDAREAIPLVERELPDVLLLDIMMPHVSGLEILASLRQNTRFADLPVIILTAASDKDTKLEALRLGATEFLPKPVDSIELETRLLNVLVSKARQDRLRQYAWELELEVAIRCMEVAEVHREVVHCLATVAEYRDNETGKHAFRVGRYTEIIAKNLGMDHAFIARIRQAASLHDIGKIGVPDRVLLKPGKLDADEIALMRKHSWIGLRVCSQGLPDAPVDDSSHAHAGQPITAGANSPLLRMTGTVAYTHHERWDGGGYPEGKKGEDIPIEGRITALADVFDALTSQRPHKRAFSLEESLKIIESERAKHFDPKVLDAFLAGLDEVRAVYHEFRDPAEPAAPTPAWPI